MDQEFLNLFIENMSKKIEELTRKEIFNMTQIFLLEKKSAELQKVNYELEQENLALKTKPSRKKNTEVNTPEQFGEQ
ncbi:MAG: hypothetical protein P4L79_09795 [Legionella sp.]|uniref:hypothetical protein n=1 Tax=Legionella sp. TaxID=459 RepID=UPI0028467C13|nr:hypothetical protein [Legionella sp.]